MNKVVFAVGYAFIVSEGLRCYNAFHPDSKNIRTRNSKLSSVIRFLRLRTVRMLPVACS
mgnify:CR=1 FL=1